MTVRLFAMVLIVGVSGFCVAAEAGEKQQEPIVPKKKTALWNGKDFTGWKLFIPDKKVDVNKVWSVKDGVIYCEGRPAGYMRTEADYANFKLHVEWRWPKKGGNSGVLLHMSTPDKVWPKSLECQLMSGNAGDFWLFGDVKIKEHTDENRRFSGAGVKKLKRSSEKPLGEWNVYEIICKDNWMVVLVNGVLQNVATGTSVTSGKICLQSEGVPIEFRNIYLEPLE